MNFKQGWDVGLGQRPLLLPWWLRGRRGGRRKRCCALACCRLSPRIRAVHSVWGTQGSGPADSKFPGALPGWERRGSQRKRCWALACCRLPFKISKIQEMDLSKILSFHTHQKLSKHIQKTSKICQNYRRFTRIYLGFNTIENISGFPRLYQDSTILCFRFFFKTIEIEDCVGPTKIIVKFAHAWSFPPPPPPFPFFQKNGFSDNWDTQRYVC